MSFFKEKLLYNVAFISVTKAKVKNVKSCTQRFVQEICVKSEIRTS